VDILTGPEPKLRSMGIKAKDRRAYPKPKINLHAHTLDEALTLEEHLQAAIIDGRRSNGEAGRAEVFLPHSFTFIMMKAFALRDRIDDSEKDYGRHHALDLYTTVAMMTEEDWDISLELRRTHSTDNKVIEAGELVKQLFGDEFRRGVLRLKESKYYRTEFLVSKLKQGLRSKTVKISRTV
jgi:hypothetical protein